MAKDIDLQFNCSKCGLCCSGIGKVIEAAKKFDSPMAEEMRKFPYSYDESGRCENLGDDNMCKVYDNRPDICSIDKVYERFISGISRKEWYRANESECKKLIHDRDIKLAVAVS